MLKIDRRSESLLAVAGDIDAGSVAALYSAVAELTPHAAIDLAGCTFMDSSGLAWLIDAKNSAAARHGSITLTAVSETVTRLLSICGLINVFEIGEAPGNPSDTASPGCADDGSVEAPSAHLIRP